MRVAVILLLICGVVCLAGCGSSLPKAPGNTFQNELKGAPDWVISGQGDESGQLYGLGSIGGTNNISLARSTAEGRGRTAIARTIQTTVESMLKDYQATTTGGGEYGKAAMDDQLIEDVSRQVTEMSVSGARQTESWISDAGTYYVLMSVETESVINAISEMGTLSEEIRRAVAARAKSAFEDLDRQTQ